MSFTVPSTVSVCGRSSAVRTVIRSPTSMSFFFAQASSSTAPSPDSEESVLGEPFFQSSDSTSDTVVGIDRRHADVVVL